MIGALGVLVCALVVAVLGFPVLTVPALAVAGCALWALASLDWLVEWWYGPRED